MTSSRLALTAAVGAALAACAYRDTVAHAPPTVPTRFETASPTLAGTTCPATVAQRLFARAACACLGSSLADLVTDGDVGIVGGLFSAGQLQVGGSLVVSGGGLEAGTTLQVGGDLALGGPLGRPSSDVTVAGSARIGGDVSVRSFSVGGTLTTPPGAAVTAAAPGGIQTGGTASADVTVAPPCHCGSEEVDFAAILAQHRVGNDNGPLSEYALWSVSGPVLPLELPAGVFYLHGIQGPDSVTIRAKGVAALVVGDGGISLGGALAVELDPGAQLDLFVVGAHNLPPTLRLGDPARPSALRIWLAQGGAVNVPAGAQVAAALYAPAADLAIQAPELAGAVLVGRINNAPLRIRYDPAIASATPCGP